MIDQLEDSLSISEEKLNLLFAALFLTSIGVFVGGNLLLRDASVLLGSMKITLSCLAMLPIFYALSRATGSVAWGLILTYGLMLLVVWSRQAWLIPVAYGGAFVALVYAMRFLRVKRTQWALLLSMAIIATVAILGVTRAYTSFDMLNRLRAGNVHQDTLYHASIAAMIKNYGVVSTGLHGIVETPYHILSHALVASISLLSGAGVIEVYGVTPWVFFAPLLVFSVVVCSGMLDRTDQLSMPLSWGITCMLLVVSPLLLRRWAVLDSYFVSESYLVSLGLLLLGLPILFRRRLRISDLFMVLVLTALIANAKASVGLLFAVLWLARVLFVRGERICLDVAALALSAGAAAWVTFHSAEANQGSISIFPLHFIATRSALGEYMLKTGHALLASDQVPLRWLFLASVALLSFFAFHFLPSWVIIGRTVYRRGFLSVFRDPLSVYSLAAAAAGILVVFLFSIPGGSAYYFTNVSFFVALPGVVVLLAFALHRGRVAPQPFLVLGILLACLLSVRALNRVIATNPSRSAPMRSAFIDSLVQLRSMTPVNTALRLAAEASVDNPVSRCTAQPFVYPAVSERPWIDVIRARNDCTYGNYGYGQYGITESQQTVTVQPRLLPGMTILNWPHAAPESIENDRVSTKLGFDTLTG